MEETSKLLLKSSRESSFFNICEKCSKTCCRKARPPLTSKRINIIKEFLLTEKIEIKSPFKKEIYTFPREVSNGYCVFFDVKARECKIHLLKPETCVVGPITFDINIEKGAIEWYLKSEKICNLADMLYRNQDILKKHVESAKREINNLVKTLSKKELLAILSIEEPDTFKIGEDALDSEVLKKLC